MITEDAHYGFVHDIIIGNEKFQLQSVEIGDEKFFILKRFGKVECVLLQNDKNEWEADCELGEKELLTVREWIKKLYNE